MTRAVSSTLAAESQSLDTASGTVEWIMLLLSEVLDGPFKLHDCREKLSCRKPILVTDCKSLYDHLMSPSAPTAIEGRRTSIDVALIRESIRSLSAFMRWVPTDRMLADALTKDQGDPLDMLHSCLKVLCIRYHQRTMSCGCKQKKEKTGSKRSSNHVPTIRCQKLKVEPSVPVVSESFR